MKLCNIAILDYSIIFAKMLKNMLKRNLNCNKFNITIFTNITDFKNALLSKKYDLYIISDILYKYTSIELLEWLKKEIGLFNFPMFIITVNEANVEKLKKFLNSNKIDRDKVVVLYKPISEEALIKLLEYIHINGEKIENLKKAVKYGRRRIKN